MAKKVAIYPKRPRLKDFPYKGSYAYFVTISTGKKSSYFKEPEAVSLITAILREDANRYKFLVYAYCFMPDHLHLLLVGGADSHLGRFIKVFKHRSGFQFKQRYGINLWQPSYYDHVLRKEESLKDVARYIFENPVRAGLVKNFRNYPFLGSMVYGINDFL